MPPTSELCGSAKAAKPSNRSTPATWTSSPAPWAATVTETIKRTRQPYFVLHGNVRALLAAKDHVNVFLYDGGNVPPNPEGIITGGHENKLARTVAIRQDETINAPALTAIFRHIIANNRGDARKLKHQSR
jgi:Domain of unknown function (DU1801)